jgi:hypothetical protein
LDSDAKRQYDHIYGRGTYEKVFQGKAWEASQENPDTFLQDALTKGQNQGQDIDPLADLYS